MLKLNKSRNGLYTEESVFYINCYKRKYNYKLASDAIAHIERDNQNEIASNNLQITNYAACLISSSTSNYSY